MAKKGLGKGLSALLGEYGDYQEEKLHQGEYVVLLSLSKIVPNPNQPRRHFDEAKLQELADSLKEFGLLQPIIVTEKDDGYEIVAGERRWRAAAKAGIKEIPCIVRQLDEQKVTEFSLIENIQRENLNALEEAQTYKKLQETYGYTQEQLAEKLGKSRPHIANTLRLLALPSTVQVLLVDGRLTAGHCRAILMLTKPAQQLALAHKIVEQGLSVRQAEYTARLLSGQKPVKSPKTPTAPSSTDVMLQNITERLRNQFGTKVALEQGKKGGKIVIEYYNEDDLARLLEQLLPGSQF